MKKLVLFIGVLLSSTMSAALDEGRFQLGVMGGHVGLQESVGDIGGNSLGVGALAGYAVRDDVTVNIGYLRSDHDEVEHSELFVGADHYFAGGDAVLPFFSGGFSLLTNELVYPAVPEPISVTGEAFGLFVGGGVDFELGGNFLVGLQGRYQFAFDAESAVDGEQVKTVEDSVTVMARAVLLFGSSSWW